MEVDLPNPVVNDCQFGGAPAAPVGHEYPDDEPPHAALIALQACEGSFM